MKRIKCIVAFILIFHVNFSFISLSTKLVFNYWFWSNEDVSSLISVFPDVLQNAIISVYFNENSFLRLRRNLPFFLLGGETMSNMFQIIYYYHLGYQKL